MNDQQQEKTTVKIVYHNGTQFFEFLIWGYCTYDPRCDMRGLLPHLRQKNWWNDELEAEVLSLYPNISTKW